MESEGLIALSPESRCRRKRGEHAVAGCADEIEYAHEVPQIDDSDTPDSAEDDDIMGNKLKIHTPVSLKDIEVGVDNTPTIYSLIDDNGSSFVPLYETEFDQRYSTVNMRHRRFHRYYMASVY